MMRPISSGKKVAIIGGGFTGLTAAYRLTKAGFAVTLYEKSDALGGLVSGFTLRDGTHLERAYHFLYKTDNYIIEFIKELGIYDKLTFHTSSIKVHYRGLQYSLVTPMDLIKFTPLSFIDRIRTGLVGFYLHRVKNWDTLTKITAYGWLTKYNGKKATKLIWEPLLRGKFDKYYDKVTMAWLWARIKVRQDSKDKGELSEKLGYFDGGFNVITEAVVEYLEKHKVQLQLSQSIEALLYDETYDMTNIVVNGQRILYDAVVCTTPTNVFSKLIKSNKEVTEEYINKLSSIGYLSAVLMVFTSRQEIANTYWHQIHDEDAPFLVMINLTALTGTEQFRGKNVYYIGDYVPHDHKLFSQMSDDEIKRTWFAGVTKLFPDFDCSQVEEVYVFKFGNAQHIVDVGYEEKLPEYRTPIPHIFLANFSQIYPHDRGTNYAVREGNRIAEMVRQDLEYAEASGSMPSRMNAGASGGAASHVLEVVRG